MRVREDEVAGEAAGHEDLAVREVDQLQDPVDQGVAEGDERVEKPVGETADEQAPEVLGEAHRRSVRSSSGQYRQGDRGARKSEPGRLVTRLD